MEFSGFKRDVGDHDSNADLGAICEVATRVVLQRCRRRALGWDDVRTAPEANSETGGIQDEHN